MNAIKRRIFVWPLALLLFSCGESREEKTKSEDEVVKELVKQERKNQERAQKGGDQYDITVITDAKEVEKLRAEINQKKKRWLAAQQAGQNMSLAERYNQGDRSLANQIIRIFKSGNAKEKKALYNDLEFGAAIVQQPTPQETELFALILNNITTKDEEDAIQLAGFYKIPGYKKAFEERLLSGKSVDEDRLFYWLGSEGSSIMAFDHMANRIRKKQVAKKDIDAFLFSGLREFGDNGNAVIQKKVGALAFEIYQNQLIEKTYYNDVNNGPAREILYCIFNFGGPEALPLIKKYAKNKYMEDDVLCARVRLQEPGIRKILSDQLSDPYEFDHAVKAALYLYKKTKDESVVKELFAGLEKAEAKDESSASTFYIDLINENYTSLALDAPKYLGETPLANELVQKYRHQTITAEEVARDLYAFGVLEKPFTQADMAAAKTAYENDEYYEVKDVYDWEDFLQFAQVYKWLDTETGFVPADYDTLISELARQSRRKLDGLQVWMDAKETGDGETYDYTITLVFKDRAYVGKPQDIGDWYDVEFVGGLLNRMLEEAGMPERFNNLDVGDQTTIFFFGKPTAVKKFSKKYFPEYEVLE